MRVAGAASTLAEPSDPLAKPSDPQRPDPQPSDPQPSDPQPFRGVARAHSLLSNEEVITRLFDAFSRRRLADALPLLHPEIVFQPITADVAHEGEPYRGHDGICRYVADVEALWDELILHPSQIRAAGNAVVALGLVSGRGPAGSFEDAPTTWMFKFKDGLVIQARIFSQQSHAHEALGESASEQRVA